MKTKFFLLALSLLAGSTAFGQWSNSGNNYTTGKVGIGLNNTTGKKLYVKQTSGDHSAVFESTIGNGVIISSNVDPLRVGSAGNHFGNHFIIDETGTVGIGTGFNFNTNYRLHVSGNVLSSGTVAANAMSAYVYYTGSDRILKKDIKEDFLSFNRLYDIKTYNYELKAETNGKRHFGVMAQEIGEIYPDLVSETSEGTLAVNYIELIPQMIRALQEQKQMITALESQITNLKSELETSTNLSAMSQINLIYPNPASESATVTLSNAKDLRNATLELIDLNGHVILTRNFDGRSSLDLNTSSINKGVYFVRLMDGQQQIETKRLLVE